VDEDLTVAQPSSRVRGGMECNEGRASGTITNDVNLFLFDFYSRIRDTKHNNLPSSPLTAVTNMRRRSAKRVE
jgi:hypothetical protein